MPSALTITIVLPSTHLFSPRKPANASGSAIPSWSTEFGMSLLTLFGLFAVSAMLVCYALEDRSHWFVLSFAASCAMGSAYGFLQGARPFGLVEAICAVVALRRWVMRKSWIPLKKSMK